MSFLSDLVRKRPDGMIDQEFTNYWSQKRRSAGGNSESEMILKAIQGEDVPLTEILAALEASARKGSEYSARELGEAYANYGGKAKYLKDLPPDMDKALYWFKFGAGLGDPRAMEVVCAHYDQGDSRNKIAPNYDEAAKWCVIAAQAECNSFSAVVVSHLYQCGLGGLPRSLYRAAYWSRVAHERRWGTAPHHSDKDLHFRPDECK